MVIWQKVASQDIESIYRYISIDNPSAAETVVATIIKRTTAQLTAFPNSGKIGRVAGTRELIVSKTPYIAVYRIKNDHIDILAVQHTSRKWPLRFE